jgi:hypothetical protein
MTSAEKSVTAQYATRKPAFAVMDVNPNLRFTVPAAVNLVQVNVVIRDVTKMHTVSTVKTSS